MSILFTQVEDCIVIIRKNGVEYQRYVFERNDKVYIQHGSGFIGAHRGGTTTIPNVKCLEWFNMPKTIFDKLGRMVFK